MGFFQRNRDPIFVALLTGTAIVVLNALVPEIRGAVLSALGVASWLVRPMRWPPALLLVLILATVLRFRRGPRRKR